MHVLSRGAALAIAALLAQSYPPAYPRAGATRLFENARVVVWNIAWLKGQPSPLHRHVYDLVGIYYAPGDRMIIGVDGSKRPVSTKAGDIAYQLKGITHIEEGTSESPLRAVFVELKDEGLSGRTIASAAGTPGFSELGAKSLLDNERVAVWSYGLGPQNPRHRHTRDAVVAWIDGGTPHAIFVPAGTVHAQEQAGVTATATVFEIKDTVEREIHAMEQQWNDARAKADVATLDRILVDDWTVTHSDGSTDTKARYLADLKSGARKFSGGVTESDVAIRVYGDTAVAAGSSNSTVTLNGQAQGGALHFTRVYVRRDGVWKMIVSHATTRKQ